MKRFFLYNVAAFLGITLFILGAYFATYWYYEKDLENQISSYFFDTFYESYGVAMVNKDSLSNINRLYSCNYKYTSDYQTSIDFQLEYAPELKEELFIPGLPSVPIRYNQFNIRGLKGSFFLCDPIKCIVAEKQEDLYIVDETKVYMVYCPADLTVKDTFYDNMRSYKVGQKIQYIKPINTKNTLNLNKSYKMINYTYPVYKSKEWISRYLSKIETDPYHYVHYDKSKFKEYTYKRLQELQLDWGRYNEDLLSNRYFRLAPYDISEITKHASWKTYTVTQGIDELYCVDVRHISKIIPLTLEFQGKLTFIERDFLLGYLLLLIIAEVVLLVNRFIL